jgi:hypothetical protein
VRCRQSGDYPDTGFEEIERDRSQWEFISSIRTSGPDNFRSTRYPDEIPSAADIDSEQVRAMCAYRFLAVTRE